MRSLVSLASLATALFLAPACHAGPKANAPAPNNTVHITVTEKGFEPSKATVVAGKPVTLVVTRTTDQTCATSIVVPEANVKADLPLNKPVTLTFTPPHSGELAYQCGMGMVKGSLLVTQ